MLSIPSQLAPLSRVPFYLEKLHVRCRTVGKDPRAVSASLELTDRHTQTTGDNFLNASYCPLCWLRHPPGSLRSDVAVVRHSTCLTPTKSGVGAHMILDQNNHRLQNLPA